MKSTTKLILISITGAILVTATFVTLKPKPKKREEKKEKSVERPLDEILNSENANSSCFEQGNFHSSFDIEQPEHQKESGEQEIMAAQVNYIENEEICDIQEFSFKDKKDFFGQLSNDVKAFESDSLIEDCNVCAKNKVETNSEKVDSESKVTNIPMSEMEREKSCDIDLIFTKVGSDCSNDAKSDKLEDINAIENVIKDDNDGDSVEKLDKLVTSLNSTIDAESDLQRDEQTAIDSQTIDTSVFEVVSVPTTCIENEENGNEANDEQTLIESVSLDAEELDNIENIMEAHIEYVAANSNVSKVESISVELIYKENSSKGVQPKRSHTDLNVNAIEFIPQTQLSAIEPIEAPIGNY
jgi:hypothetical protein